MHHVARLEAPYVGPDGLDHAERPRAEPVRVPWRDLLPVLRRPEQAQNGVENLLRKGVRPTIQVNFGALLDAADGCAYQHLVAARLFLLI